MNNVYVIAKFTLKDPSLKDEWKVLSDKITEDIKANAKGFIFRDVLVDDEGNVQCILKWESREDQEAFKKVMDERFKNEPELMEQISKFADMSTMSKEVLEVL